MEKGRTEMNLKVTGEKKSNYRKIKQPPPPPPPFQKEELIYNKLPGA